MSIRCMFRGTMFSVYLRLVCLFSLANGGSVRVGGMVFVQGNLE